MLEWSQIQAIADKVAGVERLGIIRPTDLDEPWRTIFERVEPVEDLGSPTESLGMAERALWRGTEGLEDRRQGRRG